MTPQPVRNPPAPGTPQWRRMITASKAPAMIRDGLTGEYLGLGYTDAYSLFHDMAGTWTPDPPDEKLMARGHWMEPAAREFWRWSNPGWRVSPGEVAFTDPDLPFPNQATIDLRASRGRSRRIVEVKSPRKDQGVHDKWLIQVTLQMRLSGIHAADVVLMPQYGEERIIPVEYDEDLAEAIIADCAHFWSLLEAGTPPDAGGSENAAHVLAALHPTPEKTAETVLEQDVMDDLQTAWDRLADAKDAAQTAENRVMAAMGDTGKAVFDGRKVAGRSPGRFAQKRFPEQGILSKYMVPTEKLDTAALKADHPDLYAQAVGDPSFQFERKAWS
ncbi:hypothetical protein ACT3SZ_12365 [Corynebacterium sp. AOP40-9SA-29]|uniref:hypothetical protein n=1 Tax=Corynebacterium sp. AOP40-9SA-29 TaxID=3457677 RepID=UPI0040348395